MSPTPHPLPAAAGFDPALAGPLVRLATGGQHLSRTGEVITTTLGSCVAACLRDPAAGVAGMNHFLLPEPAGEGFDDLADTLLYGRAAMDRLIADLLAAGAARHRLEVKVFGGADVMEGLPGIGSLNARFIQDYLRANRLTALRQDLGGTRRRRIFFLTATGQVFVKSPKDGEDRP